MKKSYLLTGTLISILFCGVNIESKSVEPVKKELYGMHKGKEVYLLTLTNKKGNVLKLTNFGARITWIEVPDRNGVKDNVTLGSDSFETTIHGDPFGGAVVGRYANRIGGGKFTIDGIEYNTPLNNKTNTLHGGPGGWYSVVWDTEVPKKGKYPSVRFSYLSPDMEEGFPGTVNAEVLYTWTDNNEIIIDYKATTDKKTVINLTNHAYFNLHGAGNGDIVDHILVLRASSYTPVNSGKIPTGEIRAVSGTPFDFTTAHAIGERIKDSYDRLAESGGYDHNYVLDNKEEVDVEVFDPVSGRFMEVITDQPGMQLYTGSGVSSKRTGPDGKVSVRKAAFALESGHFPDSPNIKEFPSTLLNPGDTFKSRTIYRFSVKKK